MDSEIGRIFLEGDGYVEGLVFNDVVLDASDVSEEDACLPSEIIAEQTYTHSYVFDLSDIRKDLLTQPEYLRVIAVMSNGVKGGFVNCNSSKRINGEPFAPDVAVEEIPCDTVRREIGRYSLDGRHIDKDSKGLQIVRYSDGTASKVIMR